MIRLLLVILILLIPLHVSNISVSKIVPLKVEKTIDQREYNCLAQNIYYETRGEGYDGMVAVAMVTMNRVQHKSFPKTVCDVVHQRNDIACQFSWVCNESLPTPKGTSWDLSKDIAYVILHMYEDLEDITQGALFFHAEHVAPYWSKKFEMTKQIGKHLFYRI